MKRKDGAKNKTGQGRPPVRQNGKRHTVYVGEDVWTWLQANGGASEMIDKLAREKMNAIQEPPHHR